MMSEEDIKSLLAELGGDEHAWVDFKQDYEIGGIAPKKAEFIKDVSSLANTLTDQEKHYLFIGVNDEGDIVGISSGRENYRGAGPRHIFSYDESDIQEIVDSYLEPAPKIEWHTFEEDECKFGVLMIDPLPAPPALIAQDIHDDAGNRLLHKGLIFIRKGSGKKIAGHEELERLIKYRIEKQREQILDGIHKSIDIGPEWVDRIGEALPDEPGVPLVTTQNPDEADVEVTQRITREPASTLDEQLNEDIAQWDGRGDDFIEPGPLYAYYTNPDELRLDKLALKFLTQSAIKNYQLGAFWLEKATDETQREILLATPDKHHRLERAAKVLLLMDDRDTFNDLMEKSSSNPKRGTLRDCKQKMGNSSQSRINYLIESNEGYTLKHNSWKKEFRPKDMDVEEIRELIPQVTNQLVDLQRLFENQKAWNRTYRFRDALWDLEVILGSKTLP